VLADCHTHLDRYPAAARQAMLARAAAAGLRLVLVAGVGLVSSRRIVGLAARQPLVRAGVGLHPIFVRRAVPERTYVALDALAAAPAVVVWSELGLDYQAGPLSPAAQRDVFRRQLLLARLHRLAAIVHVVEAADDALAVLAETGMAARTAVHYFVGDRALAERYLAAGLYLSVGKPVTRPENAALREAVRAAPLDRLLLETDTYPLPGRATEPSDVRQVAAAVAELRDLAPAAVARATTANLARLLGDRWHLPAEV
jgi:TatD DNase family protein